MFTIIFKMNVSVHVSGVWEVYPYIFFVAYPQATTPYDMAELMTYRSSIKCDMGHNVGVLQWF